MIQNVDSKVKSRLEGFDEGFSLSAGQRYKKAQGQVMIKNISSLSLTRGTQRVNTLGERDMGVQKFCDDLTRNTRK